MTGVADCDGATRVYELFVGKGAVGADKSAPTARLPTPD